MFYGIRIVWPIDCKLYLYFRRQHSENNYRISGTKYGEIRTNLQWKEQSEQYRIVWIFLFLFSLVLSLQMFLKLSKQKFNFFFFGNKTSSFIFYEKKYPIYVFERSEEKWSVIERSIKNWETNIFHILN